MNTKDSLSFTIGSRVVSKVTPPYLIAEIGTNHNRYFATAKKLIDLAKSSGFDAIKFQIYEPSEIVAPSVRTTDYALQSCYGDIAAQEMFGSYLQTPKDWFPNLIDYSHSLDLHVGATIHGPDGLRWFNTQNFDFLKIASMDHNNYPLITLAVENVNVPILASLGMAELIDVIALKEILDGHTHGYGLFHCTTIYPPSSLQERLGNISYLSKTFEMLIGFSDHNLGSSSAITALYCGARFFEKHITLDKDSVGPDHSFASDAISAFAYKHDLHKSFNSLYSQLFEPLSPEESSLRQKYLKSCFTSADLAAGHVLKEQDIVYARPGTGIPVSKFSSLIGKTTRTSLPGWTMLNYEHFL